MLVLSTQLQNMSFHVVERTRTSSKYQKMKNARAKRAKILFFIVKYANLRPSRCRRRRGCLSSLLLYRHTATWNLFYIIKKLKYTKKMPFYFKFRHFDRHENSTDVILCLQKIKQTDWLLCVAKNCDWFKVKIKKNLNQALSSSVCLSSNRS